jgi:chromosome segregation ATPase
MSNATPVSVELRGDFAKLKGEVEEAQRKIIEAAEQDQTDIDAQVNEARRSADARAAELRDKPQEADRPDSHWQQVRSDWNRHIQSTRAHIDAKKAEIDANDAEDDAAMAEIDAEDAIDFAESAISEAEYAVLNAVRARKKANALAGSA